MTDYTDLIRRAEELLAAVDEEDGPWSYWDYDPAVAWDVPESLHGRIGVLLEAAGWERCYHRVRARLHYNVKTGGPGVYWGYQETVAAYLDGLADEDEARAELERYAEDVEQWGDLYHWWELDLPDKLAELGLPGPGYSCGRSGGYVQAPGTGKELSAPAWIAPQLIALAEWLRYEVDYYNSDNYGATVARQAIELHEEFDEQPTFPTRKAAADHEKLLAAGEVVT